jgi:hypothetical protein
MPTPPGGDIACAASPMHSSPGRRQRIRQSTRTVRSLTESQSAISPTPVTERRSGRVDTCSKGVQPGGLNRRIGPTRNNVRYLPVVAAIDTHDGATSSEHKGRRQTRIPGSGRRPRYCAAVESWERAPGNLDCDELDPCVRHTQELVEPAKLRDHLQRRRRTVSPRKSRKSRRAFRGRPPKRRISPAAGRASGRRVRRRHSMSLSSWSLRPYLYWRMLLRVEASVLAIDLLTLSRRLCRDARYDARSTDDRLFTNGGRMTILSGVVAEGLADLRTRLRGDALVASDDGYDATRAIWNGMIDKRPGVIVRCAGVSDVVEAVRFARAQDWRSRSAAEATAPLGWRCATADL